MAPPAKKKSKPNGVGAGDDKTPPAKKQVSVKPSPSPTKTVKKHQTKWPIKIIVVRLCGGFRLCWFQHQRHDFDHPAWIWPGEEQLLDHEEALARLNVMAVCKRNDPENKSLRRVFLRRDLMGQLANHGRQDGRPLNQTAFVGHLQNEANNTAENGRAWANNIGNVITFCIQKECVFHRDLTNENAMEHLNDHITTQECMTLATSTHPTLTTEQILADDEVMNVVFGPANVAAARTHFGEQVQRDVPIDQVDPMMLLNNLEPAGE